LKKLKKSLLLTLLVILLSLTSCYCQSKSDKYPQQTIFNGDTVVILRLSQAIEMNKSFMSMQRKIDSINAIADTLETVVLKEESKVNDLQKQLSTSVNLLDKRYIRKDKTQIIGNTIIGVVAFTAFFIVANELNKI